jgi:hypothetical protein
MKLACANLFLLFFAGCKWVNFSGWISDYKQIIMWKTQLVYSNNANNVINRKPLRQKKGHFLVDMVIILCLTSYIGTEKMTFCEMTLKDSECKLVESYVFAV